MIGKQIRGYFGRVIGQDARNAMSVPDPRKDMVVEPEKKSGISKLDIVQCCLSVSVFIGLAIYFTKDGDWFFLQLSGVLVVLYMAYLLLRRD